MESETHRLQEEAREQAARLGEEFRRQGKELFEGQRRAASGQIEGFAGALHTTAHQLHEQQQEGLGRFVDSAADEVSRFAHRMREGDAAELLRATEDFARRRPALFLGATVAGGVLLSQLIRTTAYPEEHHEEPRHPAERETTGMGQTPPGSSYPEGGFSHE